MAHAAIRLRRLLSSKPDAKLSLPSDFEHAVGLERLELLGQLAGRPVFSTQQPLQHARGPAVKGTPADPVVVESLGEAERLVGCSGIPRDSHDIRYFWVRDQVDSRCSECGQAFALHVIHPPHHDE